MELDPSDSQALLGLISISVFLDRRGTTDPAEAMERLLAVDPFWPPAHVAGWMWHTGGGDFEGALAAATRGWDLEPGPAYGVFRGLALLELGRPDDAAEALEPLTRMEGEINAWRDLGRALYHGARGETDRARTYINDDVRAWAEPDGQYCWHVAQVYAVIGDTEGVLHWMERAVENQFWNWRFLDEHERLFDGMRDEPGFEALIRRARERSEATG